MAPVLLAINNAGFQIDELVCGMASGVDIAAYKWAKRKRIKIYEFYAPWYSKDGELDRDAGFKRNERMAEFADALIAVWDGESKGTKHMINCMKLRGKPLYCLDTSEL